MINAFLIHEFECLSFDFVTEVSDICVKSLNDELLVLLDENFEAKVL